MNQAAKSAVIADAEHWYARLKAADCSAAERIEFDRWRATPEHAAAFAATERLWQSLGQLAGHPEFADLSRQILPERGVTATHTRSWLAIAASILVVLAGGGVFLAIQDREIPAVVYATQPGQRRTIQLVDGSQLTLNSATEIDVLVDSGGRRLTLHKGEALFNVAHDEARPFKVAVGDGEVTALGTRFQVRNEAQRVTVTLLEGRIAVDHRETGEHVLLAPGDQVRFTSSLPKMNRRTVEPDVVASWSTGRLRFRSTSLAEALDEVNRYTSTPVQIADATLTTIPISGTFAIGDSASVVAALEAVLPIQATRQSDGAILLRHR